MSTFVIVPGACRSATPGLCPLSNDRYIGVVDSADRDTVLGYLEGTQRPQGLVALREKWRDDGSLREQPEPPAELMVAARG